jgi:hypothetical protein
MIRKRVVILTRKIFHYYVPLSIFKLIYFAVFHVSLYNSLQDNPDGYFSLGHSICRLSARKHRVGLSLVSLKLQI